MSSLPFMTHALPQERPRRTLLWQWCLTSPCLWLANHRQGSIRCRASLPQRRHGPRAIVPKILLPMSPLVPSWYQILDQSPSPNQSSSHPEWLQGPSTNQSPSHPEWLHSPSPNQSPSHPDWLHSPSPNQSPSHPEWLQCPPSWPYLYLVCTLTL